MTKYFLFTLCFCTMIKASAQRKKWEAIVFTSYTKEKGVLKEANDSGLVLLSGSGEQRFLYIDIKRMKFIHKRNRTPQVIGGIVVGASLGATITANHLSKGRTGEPAALSGVLGGIGGGIAGGFVGAFTTPLLFDLLFARRISIEHGPNYYQLLHQKLQPYIAK